MPVSENNRIKNKTSHNASTPDSPARNIQVLDPPNPRRPSFLRRTASISIAIADSRILFFVCLAVFPLAVLAYYPTKGEDYDLWFHLAYGRDYVQNLSWNIAHSQFSWTPAYDDWTYVTWIGSGLLYLAHEIFDVKGLFLVQWLVFLGAIAAMTVYARSAGGRMNITILTGMLIVLLTIKLNAVYIKPEMFTILFFFIATAVYFHGKQTEKKDFFWVYPILFFIWVNTHGGVFAGLTLAGLIMTLETLARLGLPGQALAWPRYKRLLLSAGLTIPVIMINPGGVSYILKNTIAKIPQLSTFLPASAAGSESGAADGIPTLLAYYSLWDYILPVKFLPYFIFAAWSILIMGIVFTLLLFAYMLHKRSIPLAIIGINLFFFLLSMSLARAVLFYPAVWFFSMIYLAREMNSFQLLRKASPAALVVFVVLSAYTTFTILLVEPSRSWLGANLDEYVPIKAVQFIEENHLPGPIFNDYLNGGYIMWTLYPDYKVFMDSRKNCYGVSFQKDFFNHLQYTPETFRNKYEFNLALVNMRHPQTINWLVNSPEWSMVYFDKVAAVLMHRSIMHHLSPEARALDVGPQRFRDVKNPAVLLNLFDFYKNFSANLAAEIQNTYASNVSPLYLKKLKDLLYMNATLTEMSSPRRSPAGQVQEAKTAK
jgi:hypothetical protein